MDSRKIIGIAGASGSGKTTIAKQLLDHYGDQAIVISCDNYYNDLSGMSEADRSQVNFDHPNSLDFDLLGLHLQQLKSGKPVNIPTYDFSTHSRTQETILVEPKPIIILEGILVFHPEVVCRELDCKIFMKTKIEICNQRRKERDVKERGRTPESVDAQIKSTVNPMYREFVEPTLSKADHVVANDSSDFSIDIKSALQVIATKPSKSAWSPRLHQPTPRADQALPEASNGYSLNQ